LFRHTLPYNIPTSPQFEEKKRRNMNYTNIKAQLTRIDIPLIFDPIEMLPDIKSEKPYQPVNTTEPNLYQ
jgi:hypothetical protein